MIQVGAGGAVVITARGDSVSTSLDAEKALAVQSGALTDALAEQTINAKLALQMPNSTVLVKLINGRWMVLCAPKGALIRANWWETYGPDFKVPAPIDVKL